jgi:transposase
MPTKNGIYLSYGSRKDLFKHLVSLRNRLIRVKNQLKVSLKETADFAEKTTVKQISGLYKASLRAIEKDLAKTTKAIQVLISSDQQLNHLFNLITSVDGIGDVTATEIILTTNEFKDIKEGKRFAAYAGVVPYEHQSGSSIRGKNRVSKMANQSVKTLLHMAALVAMRYNQELKQYYERKLAEGKNKMLVINAIRNKLVLRIFACVRDNRPYQPLSTKVLQATA